MVAAGAAGILLATLFTGPLAHQRGTDATEVKRFVFYAAERGLIWAIVGAFVLAAASVALRDNRAGALGWAIVGAGSGAVGGALGGALFMLLKDVALKDFDSVAVITHGSSTALTGVVLGAAVATVMSGERATFRLAGLVGGLLGAILALTFGATPKPGQPEGASFLLIEAIVMIGALAAIAAPLAASRAAPAEAARRMAARARRPANT
jgi:MFS family permease